MDTDTSSIAVNPPMSPMDSAIGALQVEMGRTEELMNQMRVRLQPVSLLPCPKAERPSQDTPELAPVVKDIVFLTTRLQEVNDGYVDMMDRLHI